METKDMSRRYMLLYISDSISVKVKKYIFFEKSWVNNPLNLVYYNVPIQSCEKCKYYIVAENICNGRIVNWVSRRGDSWVG